MPELPTPRVKRNLRSIYKGTAGKLFFLRLGCLFLSLIPFVGLPNAICIMQRYKCNNTEIVGMPLEFNGRPGELLGKLIVWGFLSIVTVGIYGLFVLPVRYQEWITAHTVFGPVVL